MLSLLCLFLGKLNGDSWVELSPELEQGPAILPFLRSVVIITNYRQEWVRKNMLNLMERKKKKGFLSPSCIHTVSAIRSLNPNERFSANLMDISFLPYATIRSLKRAFKSSWISFRSASFPSKNHAVSSYTSTRLKKCVSFLLSKYPSAEGSLNEKRWDEDEK